MRFLIVDDEPHAIERMKRLLEDMKLSNLTYTTNPLEALEMCRYKPFDLIFLDIQMPQANGLEIAKKIQELLPSVFIIFTTAYAEYALEAFRVGAIDYLVKPFDKQDLQSAINRAVNHFEATAPMQNTQTSTDMIVGKSGERIVFIDLNEIYYLQAELSETIVRSLSGEFYVSKKFSDFFYLLNNKNFVKVHRSCIVNISKISYVESYELGKYCLHFKDLKEVIYTSKSGAQTLREIFK